MSSGIFFYAETNHGERKAKDPEILVCGLMRGLMRRLRSVMPKKLAMVSIQFALSGGSVLYLDSQ